jgi:hypothetical protein
LLSKLVTSGYKYFVVAGMEELAKYGTLLPANIMGLTDEQVEELKLVDEWGENCVPSGGWNFNKDPIGRRNGKQPNEHMQDVIKRTTEEAKAMISKVDQLLSLVHHCDGAQLVQLCHGLITLFCKKKSFSAPFRNFT